MAAIIPGVPGEDVDGISHGGVPAWFKNNQGSGCFVNLPQTLDQFLSFGLFCSFFSGTTHLMGERLWRKPLGRGLAV